MKKSISIIIPSYNSVQTIGRVLKALELQDEKGLVSEIIIVDSSDDGKTKEVLLKYESEKVKIIQPGIKVMQAIGRNIGAKNAKGDLLIFLDSDAYPGEGWLDNILQAYEKGYVVGGGCIELADFQKNKPLVLAQYYLQCKEYMCSGSRRLKGFVPACNMFCDQELFQKIGGFPEIRASEDVLFGLKASKLTKLWFLPDVRVHHVFREGWRDFFENQKLLGRYVYVYRKQYYDSFLYKGFIPFVCLPAFLCVKLVRSIIRIFAGGPYHVYRFIKILPIFLLGLWFWGIGFIEGYLDDISK